MLNWVLALLSAALLIFTFPKFSISWFAPIALTPLLIALAREPRWKRRFLLGWGAGIVYWRRAGLEVAIISGHASEAVVHRFRALGIAVDGADAFAGYDAMRSGSVSQSVGIGLTLPAVGAVVAGAIGLATER